MKKAAASSPKNLKADHVAQIQASPEPRIPLPYSDDPTLAERTDELLKEPCNDLDNLRQQALKLSGRFRSGLADLSVEHDRYLEEFLDE